MAKKAIVHCRVCKQEFNRLDPKLLEGVDWVNPSNRIYYHKACYDEYQRSRLDVHAKMRNEKWFDAAWDFLRKDLKYDFHFKKVERQWDKYLKDGKTAKGMYFALKYFYEIKKNDVTKSENGIGIIPHIYEDSCSYWQEREHREQGIVAAIEQQIKEAQNQKIIDVRVKKVKRQVKSAADVLAEIMDMEDDE